MKCPWRPRRRAATPVRGKLATKALDEAVGGLGKDEHSWYLRTDLPVSLTYYLQYSTLYNTGNLRLGRHITIIQCLVLPHAIIIRDDDGSFLGRFPLETVYSVPLASDDTCRASQTLHREYHIVRFLCREREVKTLARCRWTIGWSDSLLRPILLYPPVSKAQWRRFL